MVAKGFERLDALAGSSLAGKAAAGGSLFAQTVGRVGFALRVGWIVEGQWGCSVW